MIARLAGGGIVRMIQVAQPYSHSLTEAYDNRTHFQFMFIF